MAKIQNDVENSPLVIKHNHLIEARYSMSLTEQRVLIYALSKIDFSQSDCTKLEISSNELLKMFSLQNAGSTLSLIRKSCKNLVSINLDVSTSSTDYFVNIFSSVKHERGSGIVTIKFTEEIKPYILALKSHFTQYKIESISSFKSEYSIRIYELLKMHQYQMVDGYFYKVIEIPRFRKMLGIKETQYKHFNNFETDVLKRAKDEISSKSDIVVSYEKIKQGTKISSIKFICQLKNKITVVNNDNETEEYKTIQKKLIIEMLSVGIKQRNIDKWFNLYHIPVIKRNFEYTLKQYSAKKIKTIAAYMNKALEYDFWQSAEMEKIAGMRLKNMEYEEQQRRQFEDKVVERKQIEQKIKTLENFKLFDKGLQQEILTRIYTEYPHMKEYFMNNGLDGAYAKDFIFVIVQKMKIQTF